MASMATTLPRRTLDLPIALDPGIPNQASRVHAALRVAIVDGYLSPGLKLPSSRALAAQLGMSRNAIVAAYEQLLSDGLADARQGSGTYVAANLPGAQSAAAPAPLDVEILPSRAFALGRTYVDASLLRSLGASVRHHIVAANAGQLGYGDPRGSLLLRTEIARHLAANRGIRCDPGCIMITSGTQQGLRLCAEALLSPGDAIWLEEPGYYAAHGTLRAAGMRLIPVPVDGEGIRIDEGRKLAPLARAAYVTPSHQFPTGVTMSMARRVALLDWANAAQAWIIEDDYDSEFRYAGPPLTALAGLGGERVIYSGTFSKTLFPSLRLAYLVLPRRVAERVIRARSAADRFPSAFLSDAVAELMSNGAFAAHLRRARLRYRQARETVASVLAEAGRGRLRIVVPQQGLHMIAYLPAGLPADAGARIRAMAAVETRLLSEASLAPSGTEGFILGFSGHDSRDLAAAARRLGEAAYAYTAGRGLPAD
ncbi:GntR family transcriptional regulator [Bosea sp. 62]|uniref:MocR-like pyridoxine biosynthesis transcription factor PdxR n=1 Tax=unclassified Bosea (in: a-proteobacteria) TaxID=2653178 RepID=UPI00125C8264|nr:MULTISPECIES: PLP-dependent aminotransferase family protein [unclassified Bosea (in: a-proteobacteria)]CAD5257694.1 GntR family transcriptional regulator [Bosea sp. 46]CAD5262102.1 GntR family transcriptional regulator [Bosea sp. 21B]CAD5278403.1 GntR family transcriptional regulator [Bosea sp. 7B]VVT58641.1 GntR family transcriptional regulator / MocR family aminotransferase [Bosea sp. EC-HK365B]VXB57925.1 GntR family transcriptional regulator [Bosea sp. 29B]